MSSEVRVAVVGLGNMGYGHLGYLPKVPHVKVSAICDIDPGRIERSMRLFDSVDDKPRAFASVDELLGARVADAVLIATPHYDHPPIGIKALEAGLHVLTEKPIAVGVRAARELLAAAKKRPDKKFGIVFNQRTNPLYAKMRELIADGELGAVTRVTWLVTDWFRPNAYYASGGWRATWAGEGGGVLINQCPHNLDLLQWITGMVPSRVTAVGFIGKRHPIEVEDEMSAILEYPNGAVGHFVTSTGECPGTNRLEIAGDRGKFVAEDGKLTFTRTRHLVSEINAKTSEAFPTVERWDIDVPIKRSPAMGEHERIVRNFIDAIVNDTPLIAPGEEGVKGLETGNAMLMSAILRKSVDLPLDGAAYDQLIKDLTVKYGGKKSLETKVVEVDMAASSSSFA